MDSMSLIVNGRSFSGWKEASVTRSIEGIADTFNVSYAERWNEHDEPLPINEGEPVQVKLQDDVTLTGFVDDSVVTYAATSHDASVAGRSAPGDLVDCAAIFEGGQWGNVPLLTIVQDLCSPFSIDVELRGDAGTVFKKFALQEGEAVFDAINRAARMRGMLLLSKADGGLLITRVGARTADAVLTYGVNILSGSVTRSMRDRYSQYIAKAQVPGSDTRSGRDIVFKRESIDIGVTRYRPTVLMPSTEDSGDELEAFVKWERNRRAGAAEKITVKVQGWRDDSGQLWEPNTLVRLNCPLMRVNGERLIVAVQYSKGAGGTTAQLTLAIKEAYDLIDLPPPRPASGGHGKHGGHH